MWSSEPDLAHALFVLHPQTFHQLSTGACVRWMIICRLSVRNCCMRVQVLLELPTLEAHWLA